MNWLQRIRLDERYSRYSRYIPVAEAVVVILFLWLTFFSVRETEFVLITQFGRPVYTVGDAGLHMKWFFRTATYFDKRVRVYNPRPSEFLTRDKKNLVVESYVAWRIQDPQRFVETVGDAVSAEMRLAIELPGTCPSAQRAKLWITSSAVNVSPLVQVAPWRRCRTYSVASSLTSQLSRSQGSKVKSVV